MVIDPGVEVVLVEQPSEPTRQGSESLGSVLFGHGHGLRIADRERSFAQELLTGVDGFSVTICRFLCACIKDVTVEHAS